jgi:hypothetical protein
MNYVLLSLVAIMSLYISGCDEKKGDAKPSSTATLSTNAPPTSTAPAKAAATSSAKPSGGW